MEPNIHLRLAFSNQFITSNFRVIRLKDFIWKLFLLGIISLYTVSEEYRGICVSADVKI